MSTPNLKPAATYPALVGTVLAQLRARQGLQQGEVARAVGVGQSTWSRIENGTSALTIEQLGAASKVLRTSSDEVLRRAEEAAKLLRKRGVRVEPVRVADPLAVGLVLIAAAALVVVVLAALSKKK